MGFARREYWSALPCLHAGDLPNWGIKSASLMSPTSCGFRVTALVFCKRIATKSGFLPLWVLSYLLNETGGWPVWWVWPVGSMVKGSEPGGQGLRVWRSYSFGPFPPVGWCDPLLWPWFLPRSPPHLLAAWPPFLPAPPLDPLEQWLSDTASSRRYMAISVNNPC